MTDRDQPADAAPLVWRGVLDPSMLLDEAVTAGHRLAGAAKTADWSTVFDLLDDPDRLVDINGWRPGGPAWFTVLHQAGPGTAPPPKWRPG